MTSLDMFGHVCFNESLSIKMLKFFLELKVLGAFASGLGFNSFESCFSLIKVLTIYLLIFRFLIKKCTTLLTMYFKYKTALQPCSLTILITYFALIRLPTGTTKYVRMCQLEDCVLQNCLNFALKGIRIKN